MSKNADNEEAQPLVGKDWATRFEHLRQTTLNWFTLQYPGKVSADVLSDSSIKTNQNLWYIFIVAYPATAFPMLCAHTFFRQLDWSYLHMEIEEYWEAGNYFSEPDSPDPITYFQEEPYQADLWFDLSEIHKGFNLESGASDGKFVTGREAIMTAEQLIDKRSKLQGSLPAKIKIDKEPWPPELKRAFFEILDRFKKLDIYWEHSEPFYEDSQSKRNTKTSMFQY